MVCYLTRVLFWQIWSPHLGINLELLWLPFFSAWAVATNQSQKAFGVTLGGEFSTAINDCGLWWEFAHLYPGLPIHVVIFFRVLPSDLVFVFVLSHRLSGIGSTPGSPNCATWDNWSVSHSAICLTPLSYDQLTCGYSSRTHLPW